jgi:hypothetical protein
MPALVSEPRTPEGVPEDVVEFEGEPEAVPEVVQEEAPAEGAMIVARTAAAPLPSRGARAPLSSAPRRAVASGAATGEGMEVVLGHPTPYAPGDISVSEAVSTAHQALSQAQRVLHRVGEVLADKRRRLQLWASMLKRTTMSERAAARARQHGFDLQVDAIAQRDADSRRSLVDARELYASVEARASAVTKQEELATRARQVNQWEQEVEKLEGLLQERELDDIILRRELEALSTRETSLDRREVDLEREQKALEDVRAQILACELDADAQILACELDADAQDTVLRDQEAQLAPLLPVWRVDGGDDELVNIVTPLLGC